jgi:hypothetical protein
MRQITCDELRRELPISEWWAWARTVLAELRATDEGRAYIRFRKGPVKRLREEVIPTLRFAERQFAGRDLLATFPATAGPASPDALLRSSTSSIHVPIQVTCDWTYDDEKRLQTMHRIGWASGGVYSIEKVQAEVSASIAKLLAAKAAHGGYAENTWLLVHINDERWPPEALPVVVGRAKAAAAGLPFDATFLVGSSDEKRICELIDGGPAIIP